MSEANGFMPDFASGGAKLSGAGVCGGEHPQDGCRNFVFGLMNLSPRGEGKAECFSLKTPPLAFGQKGVDSFSVLSIGVRIVIHIGSRNGANMTFLGAQLRGNRFPRRGSLIVTGVNGSHPIHPNVTTAL